MIDHDLVQSSVTISIYGERENRYVLQGQPPITEGYFCAYNILNFLQSILILVCAWNYYCTLILTTIFHSKQFWNMCCEIVGSVDKGGEHPLSLGTFLINMAIVYSIIAPHLAETCAHWECKHCSIMLQTVSNISKLLQSTLGFVSCDESLV